MKKVFTAPSEIEAESMRLISEELAGMAIKRTDEELEVIRRVIHATADFDFAGTMVFSEAAVSRGRQALLSGVDVITDTNMARAGISRPSCLRYGITVHCFTSDQAIFDQAKETGTTRSYAAMEYAAKNFPGAVFAIGNAPTALMCLEKMLCSEDFSPALIIAVPVGFVNVTEAKERILEECLKRQIPVIAARGRKGGSPVAAAIMNALLYGIANSR